MDRCNPALVHLFALIFLSLPANAGPSAQNVHPNPALISRSSEVDKLFADWNKPDTPGCAVAVIKDGKIIYRRGYGMADLEHNSPIRPATIFHVASMSKQFTAFSIYLLAQQGKLSLDDDVRKYLPELNDFGRTITIRHLLHHTSGLRDQWALLGLAGWRLDDSITEDDILGLVWRQRNLNFLPGEQFLYSNTGYTLLGLIVARVSGKPLPEFTKEAIFDPLGMRNTHFHDEYGSLVKGRAYSYEKERDGTYEYVALSYSNVGATSLFTSVEDLALWNQNFYDGRVGGKELLAQMQTKGILNSGEEIDYAAGLEIGRYRGLNTVEHGGADAGYRSDLLRFPDQRFSVVILSNAGDLNPGLLARKVAAIYLGKALKPMPDEPKREKRTAIEIDPGTLDALVGDYELRPGFILTYTRENNQLMAQATGQPKFPLFPSAERTFFYKAVDAQVTFDKPGADGTVEGAIHHQGGHDFHMRRIRRVPLTAEELKDREGEFYSDELHVLYSIRSSQGELFLRHPRGEVQLQRGSDANSFAGHYPIGSLHYTCLPDKGCDGFTVSDGRVRDLRFTRMPAERDVAEFEYKTLDGLIGYFELAPNSIVTITRDENHLFAQVTGQLKFELFSSKPHQYFPKAIDAQVTFLTDGRGNAMQLTLRENGVDQIAKKVDGAEAKAAEEYAEQRNAQNVPIPGSEAALRSIIEGLRDQPNYDRMNPQVAQAVRQSLPGVQRELASLGTLESVVFTGVGARGEDVYAVHFAKGDVQWKIVVSAGGMIDALQHRAFKDATRLSLSNIATLRSGTDNEAATLELLNQTNDTYKIYSIDIDGELRSFGLLTPRRIRSIQTSASHLWLVGKDEQHAVAVFSASPGLNVGAIQ